MVGESTDTISHEVDARWTMAYAAGISDFNPCYLDTQAQQLLAHPVFPVCLEWPAILASRHLPGGELVTPEEAARGVHAAHDLHIERLIRPGERLHTHARVIALEQIRPGAAQTTRLDTFDDHGDLVCRTYQLSISRGVEVVGEARHEELAPEVPVADSTSQRRDVHVLKVPEGLAHVYTECARIFNPIHTDRAVALAAGLPDIILHGTATMALAVSRLVNQHLGGDPARVRRLGGRFSAMVLMPSTLGLEVDEQTDDTLFYTVRTGDGSAALSRGFLCYQ
jgi:acyl dehydratase